MRKTDLTFWYRWIVANTLAETVGLGGAFIIGYAFISLFDQPIGAIPTLLLAGLAVLLGTLEGAVVGLAQGFVLKQCLPDMGVGQWVLATAVGALVAWTLGMLPSTAMDLRQSASTAPPTEVPDLVNYLLAIGLGAVAGPILAFAQWLMLRRHVSKAWRWIPANAAAWMVGMPIVFVGPGLIGEGMSLAVIGLTIIVVVAAAGAAVGAIHGFVLVKYLLPSQRVEEAAEQLAEADSPGVPAE
jgi:hypothetical protein